MRRAFLRMCAGLGVLALRPAFLRAADQDNWTIFKRKFLRGERIADTGNGDVSHSESQGWGMLFAEDNNDRETFQKLWEWTSSKLQRPDGLFSWRWSPKGPEPVADKNNAADGDILIAWALARAAKRWDDQRLASESQGIRTAIVDHLAVELHGGRRILLPGVQGFARKDSRIVNLSYYVWPAIAAFASMAGDTGGAWRRLQTDGLSLLDRAAFGTFHLPPDWLLAGDHELKIADGWPPQFGFDAVRIPLYLAWHNDAPRLGRFLAFWRTPKFGGKPPAWINLRDDSVAPFPAPGGYTAIFALCQFVGEGFKTSAPLAGIVDSDDYYSASLKLLSNMAARDAPTVARP